MSVIYNYSSFFFFLYYTQIMENYYEKYMKYKAKYLNLKVELENQEGGGLHRQ